MFDVCMRLHISTWAVNAFSAFAINYHVNATVFFFIIRACASIIVALEMNNDNNNDE